MMRRTKAQLIVSLDRPRPHVVGGKGSIWFAEQETMPIFLSEMIGLERYYVPIQTIPLTSSDWVQLEKTLGAAISNKYRKLIEHALAHLVSSYCFKDRVPKLGELGKRVQEIKDAGERLLELCSPTPVDTVGKQKRTQRAITRGIARHVLSTGQVVNQYLVHALPTKHPSLKEYLEPVEILTQICEQGWQKIQKRASKEGAKVDTGLEYLVIVLVFVACSMTKCTDFELPSATTKTYNISNYPLLAFVREAITIGAAKGVQAIADTNEISPDEIRLQPFC